MSAALVWVEAGRMRAHNIGRDKPANVGRAEGADVHVDDHSVSREQAVIRFDGTGFRVANRSGTNPTRVNGQPTEQETPVHDQDELSMGMLNLRFHDLGVHDSISGPVCSHCGRENKATDKDCWFCGTSLVSAVSTLRTRRQVVGRVVAADGRFLDLYDGQSAVLSGGAPAFRQQGEETGGGSEVSASKRGLTVTEAGGETRQLQTGDVLEAGGTSYLVIVRG
jgi:hypothetical protein